MYNVYKDKLIENGYIPLPIVPNKKSPCVKGWASDSYIPPENRSYVNYGVGLICGRGDYPLVGIDCDISNDRLAEDMVDYILDVYGETVYRIGKPPKTLLVYRAEKSGIRKKRSKRYNIGHVEALGYGEQFVAFGIHPDTRKPYEWSGLLGSVLDIKAQALNVLRESDVIKILKHFEAFAEKRGFLIKSEIKKQEDSILDSDTLDDPLDIKRPMGLSVDQCKNMLQNLNADCDRAQWRNIGMALHHEFSGSEEGFTLWDDWSSTGAKYKINEMRNQWESFRKTTGRLVTAAFLKKLTKKENPDAIDFFNKLDNSIGNFVDNPPPVPMIINSFLPKGIIALLYSMGGAGKSTLILDMSIRIALANKFNINFLNYTISGGKVVMITAEDPDLILNKRYIAIVNSIAKEIGVTVNELKEALNGNLIIKSTFGRVIHLFDVNKDKSILGTTVYYDSLCDYLRNVTDLQLVVIDTKTRFSPGEGLGNVIATQEVTHYEQIATLTNATVMLLHHTSKLSRDGTQSGKQAYRDATALFDNTRASWYLRGLTPAELKSNNVDPNADGAYLLLENAKNSYVPEHKDLLLYRQGYRYEVKHMAAKMTQAERKEQMSKAAYDKILALLQSSTVKEFTQAEILRQAKEIEGIGRRHVVNALGELIDDNLLYKNSKKQYVLTDEGCAYDLNISTKDIL